MKLTEFLSKYEYKVDTGDTWTIPVLEDGKYQDGQYIDTYSKAWISKEAMKEFGHEFHWSKMFYFPQVALKMAITKVKNWF